MKCSFPRCLPVFIKLSLLLSVLFLPKTTFGQTTVESPPELVLQDADPEPNTVFQGAIPRTAAVAQDARLNDICSVGDWCWAVGERGVIVTSSDAGASWRTQMLPLDCSLNSVCFLTNQTGFVAGFRYDSLHRRRVAVLLKTRDGGQSWQDLRQTPDTPLSTNQVATRNLPPLTQVRFFDLENAIAIGTEDAVQGQSHVYRSQDSGKTWQILRSDVPQARWQTGAFLSAEDGLVAGHGNAVAAAVSGQLVGLSRPDQSLRRIHAAALDHTGSGWLAGDAAQLQHSTDGGISWKAVTTAVPSEFTEVLDFHAVCQLNKTVCVAGSPGSLMLKSTDGGVTWSAKLLSEPLPVRKLIFVNDTTILGLAELGIIQRSTDAGDNWTTVRNAGFRAAVMCLTTDPADVSFRMLASLAGNDGLRTVVLQPSVRHLQRDVDDALAAEQMTSALAQAGANSLVQDWMFARTQPLQAQVADELIQAWNRQTDGRLNQLLPQRLAAAIRMWRPTAICIERRSERDQVATVWMHILQQAQEIAAGAHPNSSALDVVGLSPWKVDRVVVRQTENRRTPLAFSAETPLANLGTTTELIAEFCQQQLSDAADAATQANAARQNFDAYAVHHTTENVATPQHLLSGFMPSPGTASRRMITPASAERTKQLEQLTRQMQTQQAALSNQATRSQTPLGLLAHLTSVGSGLPEPMALQQLQTLSEMYESVENLDGQIAVQQEILKRFPESPAAADAAQQLFQYYSSSELRVLRQLAATEPLKPSENSAAGQGNNATSSENALPRIQQISASDSGSNLNAPPGIFGGAKFTAGTGTPLANSRGSDSKAVEQLWDQHAKTALQHLTQLSPERAAAPEVLLRQAATLHRALDYEGHGTLLAQAAAGKGLYALLARAEMQAVHGAAINSVQVIHLPQAASKPFLDASLTDQIWQDATEIPLKEATSGSPVTSRGCLLMLAWDEDHVYVAGRVERLPRQSEKIDPAAERLHDADHGIRDRVEIAFDVDRDYTTAFHFVIDEAGQTSERCWKSRRWNPKWFVASDSDESTWRFEAAIPHSELGLGTIRVGSTWGVHLQRQVPGMVEQTLPAPDHENAADTGGFGLVKFIRSRK